MIRLPPDSIFRARQADPARAVRARRAALAPPCGRLARHGFGLAPVAPAVKDRRRDSGLAAGALKPSGLTGLPAQTVNPATGFFLVKVIVTLNGRVRRETGRDVLAPGLDNPSRRIA